MAKAERLPNLIIMSLFLLGCEKQYLANEGYTPEIIQVDAKEVKKAHFFGTSYNFNMDSSAIEAMDKILKDARSAGIDNIGFMLISNEVIPIEAQKRAKKQIYKLMYKHGFITSRIVDSGTCVYQEAKTGVRIDILKYEIKEPDCSSWSEYIGDMDTNKNLPKYGATATYNTMEMVANKADFIAPRKYRGQEVRAAIAAAVATPGSSGGSSSSSSGSNSRSSGSSGSSGGLSLGGSMSSSIGL
ncbi:MAG: CpaD family pilus assembly lipoprotein [Holosporaceae bacterium]|jgi:type IV pilus biogenesis protein CpaD/CtpE|nr:CpaD family pilus assembly lipoprotein [Holosporaceae bacterium]